ncbi:hypothetical protein ACLOJK_036193, partial [Asimina triloba]
MLSFYSITDKAMRKKTMMSLLIFYGGNPPSTRRASDLATRSTHLSHPISQPSPQLTRSSPFDQRSHGAR